MSVITTPIETLHLKSTLRLLPRAVYRSQRIQVFPPNIFSNTSLSSPLRIDPISQGLFILLSSILRRLCLLGTCKIYTFFSHGFLQPTIYTVGGSRNLWRRYASDNFSEMGLDPGADPFKVCAMGSFLFHSMLCWV